MQGRGITNYSTNPSHSFTTQTTEFDDALLKRNIITFEQAMMAKGATFEEAKLLSEAKKEKDEAISQKSVCRVENKTFDLDENDQAELEEYRSKRLTQLQHGNVIPISRTEWNHEVNEASYSQWVVIILTSTSSAPNLIPHHRDLCVKVEQEIIPHLAGKFSEVKWISIPSKSAIENWPDDNLPTLFCYRQGKMQCQLVGLGDFGNLNADSLEFKLGNMGVVESDLEMNPEAMNNYNEQNSRGRNGNGNGNEQTNSYGRSKFKGGMSTFATASDEGCSDYDDVD